MYDWLREELDSINTPKFHRLNEAPTDGWLEHELDWPAPPPPSFRAFMDAFGPMDLYREMDFYLIRIARQPIVRASRKGVEYLCFGGYSTGSAGFLPADLECGGEAPVYETVGAADFHATAPSFDAWLSMRARSARRWFNKREWNAILAGPKPFTDEELAIVESRRRITWRLTGVNDQGWLRFEVTNGADRTLPYLSIGIRAKTFIGGTSLPIGHIAPGTTAVVEDDMTAYAHLADPRDMEAFPTPDPEPEDRERYAEFRVE